MNRYLIYAATAILMATVQPVLAAYIPSQADRELLKEANQRIDKIRKADAVIVLNYKDDSPAPGINISIKQLSHRFKFGCNVFPLYDYKGSQHDTYAKEFADLFNYATLPFYWSSYEPDPGTTKAADVKKMAEWCKSNGITAKGHPLVWHETYPSWAPNDPDAARERICQRVIETVSEFKGLVDIWDVVNEATVSAQYNNGVGNWAKRDGAASMVRESLEWARSANKKATLLYNDFNVGPDYEGLLADLVAENAPFDAIGIQSHMHTGEWSLEKVWQTCETYSKFGKPIHFTEVTVLSGENGWMKPAPWPSTQVGELRQSRYVADFYTLLFSHPAVEAITWWDMMDGGWQGAPAGLVRADLTPKPAYKRLKSLIKGKWWTTDQGISDEDGLFKFRGFMGKYQVTVSTSKGTKTAFFSLEPGRNVWNIELAGPKQK